MRLADQRMYEHKAGRSSASRQSSDVLLKVLSERNADLREHLTGVSALASCTAERLGLPDHEVERIGLAAELHDVGKTAIPDAILNKPGPLDEKGVGLHSPPHLGDAPFPRLGAGVAVSWKNFPSFTRFTVLAVKRSPAGVKVKLTCKGGGCPFRSKQRTIRKATTQFNLVALLRRAKLRRGARLELRVTRAGHVGGVTTWTIRAPADPKRSDRCLVPGKTSPSRC